MHAGLRFSLLLAMAACCQTSAWAQQFADAVKVTDNRDFLQHLSWSPQGDRFLVTRIHAGKMALWTLKVDGSDWKRLVATDQPHFDGHWSADGKTIAFVFDRLQGTDGKLQIDTVHADGSEHKNLIPQKAFEESPRFAADKRLIWVSTRTEIQQIHLLEPDGKGIKQLTSAGGPNNTPSWSPDGKQIAFCSGRAGNLDIYVMNADGSNVRRLTDAPRLDYWPVWSPDGKHIAFTSNRDGNYEIYSIRPDGTGLTNLTKHPASDNYATWSPDGRRLAFISNRGGGYNIHIIALPKGGE